MISGSRDIKLAIHAGDGWNDEWRAYCDANRIAYETVDCYSPDIIQRLGDFDALMWHFRHGSPEDILMARHVLNAAEAMGLAVFPNFKTCWHYDDKIAQKYLLESIDAPMTPTWVFYEQAKAIAWLKTAELPVVAKLRRGAGSYNVRLCRTRAEATRYVKRMFSSGFSPAPKVLADAANKLRVAASSGGLQGILRRLKKAPRFFRESRHARKYFSNEKGYVYFQKFIPGNKDDLRVTVVGNRAWAFRRRVRENDFRASGSGVIEYGKHFVPTEVIQASFEITRRLGAQSVAFDWVCDEQGKHTFVEISYCYQGEAVANSGGYWDTDMRWHECASRPEHAILDDFMTTIRGTSQANRAQPAAC